MTPVLQLHFSLRNDTEFFYLSKSIIPSVRRMKLAGSDIWN